MYKMVLCKASHGICGWGAWTYLRNMKNTLWWRALTPNEQSNGVHSGAIEGLRALKKNAHVTTVYRFLVMFRRHYRMAGWLGNEKAG